MTVRTETDRPLLATDGRKSEWATFGATTRREIVALWPVFVLAALYLAAAFALAAILAGRQRLALFTYTDLWLRAGIPFGFLYLMSRILPGLVRQRPDRPLLALGRASRRYVTPEATLGVALIAVQALTMGTFTSVKNMLPDFSAYSWDKRWADIDAFLAAGVDPWRYLEPLISRPWATHMVEVFYLTGWMLMVGIVPAIVAFAPRFRPIRLRFFLTYLFCWILIGNVLAAIGMSAGPAFYAEVSGDPVRFQPLLDRLATNSGSEYSAFDLQRALWRAYETGQVSLGTGVSAFPSMHVAMATLWVMVAFAAGRVFTIAAVVFLALVLVASVALGWHYAVDGYASIVLTGLIWLGVGGVLAVARRHRSSNAPGACRRLTARS